MKGMVHENDQQDKDLMYIGSQLSVGKVQVCDLVYELLGEVSSDSEDDVELEKYLTKYDPSVSNSQGMARTKPMARKNQNKNQKQP